MKLAILASGSLGFKVLIHLIERHQIVAVLTDRNSAAIADLARTKGIPLFIGNPRYGKAHSFITGIDTDVLLSINYLFLIEDDLITWPSKLAFNIHGSLLPKYRGRTPHVWAIINNEKETGVTAHIIDEGCDTGDIIEQIHIPIEPDDTGADLLKKYEVIYPAIVDKVFQQISTGDLARTKQDESKAITFGKRIPEDGQINWNWYRERILNWVRAQAYPYPGAFTWLNNQKVTIDQVGFDDYGFRQKMKNGEIISIDPLRVKTPNGVLRIIAFREKQILFSVGEQFEYYEN